LKTVSITREINKKKPMPSKMALVDYEKCLPEKCDSGICAAALACSHKLLKQEAPYEIPMADPFLCRGCGDCVRVCPLKAIEIVRI
jgi:translation initiation factor RLI1